MPEVCRHGENANDCPDCLGLCPHGRPRSQCQECDLVLDEDDAQQEGGRDPLASDIRLMLELLDERPPPVEDLSTARLFGQSPEEAERRRAERRALRITLHKVLMDQGTPLHDQVILRILRDRFPRLAATQQLIVQLLRSDPGRFEEIRHRVFRARPNPAPRPTDSDGLPPQ